MRATTFVTLTAAFVFSTVSVAHPADVGQTPAKPERRVVLVSNAARAVITDSKLDGNFYFERCYLPNASTKTVTQALADADYTDCVAITRGIPDTEANRYEFRYAFSNAIGDLFNQYSGYQAFGRTATYATAAAVIGALVPLIKIPKLGFLYGPSLGRMAATAAASAGITGVIHGYYALDHMDDYGLGAETEVALDSEDLSSDLIVLDRTAPKARAAQKALAVFEHALSDATATTLKVRGIDISGATH